MSGGHNGFDVDKLAGASKLYGIDLSRYMPIVEEYENKLLEKQNRQYEEANKS